MTRLMINNSFSIALSIMHMLLASEKLAFGLEGSSSIWIEAYQNGREQGITIWDTRGSDATAYYVAIARRSDQVVVYKGKYSMQSISDDAYMHQNYFNTTEEAAQFIIEQLLTSNAIVSQV